jgi:hypothetical protein
MITPANLVALARKNTGPGDLTDFLVEKFPDILYKMERSGEDLTHEQKDELIASIVLFLFASGVGIDEDLTEEINELSSSS